MTKSFRREGSPAARRKDCLWLYGLHVVRSALANKRRRVKRAVLTERAAREVGADLLANVRHEITNMESIARLVPPAAVHQGAVILCEPLKGNALEDAVAASAPEARIVLVLDQISDPHNVGAILRAAAAFSATAVVVQDRHAPPQTGVLAKAASGALDIVPYVETVNIARALDQLGKLGFWRVALADDGETALSDLQPSSDIALVLGSEGSGLRRLVREKCDVVAQLPTSAALRSLNVSAAAAVALYEFRRSKDS